MIKTINQRCFNNGLCSSYFIITAKGKTAKHNHAENEVFFFIKGKGLIILESNANECRQNEIVVVPPFTEHQIINTEREDLEVFSIWFYTPSKTPAYKSNVLKILLPSFITPNGKMYLGHLAGPILAADIVSRFYRMQNINCKLISGTIGYQTNVAVAANKLQLKYKETALKYSKQILDTFNLSNVSYDVFLTLEEELSFKQVAAKFARNLITEGFAVLKTKNVAYCKCCKKYCFEAHVTGRCPHCNSKDVIGECETCSLYIQDDALLEPQCTSCGKKCIMKPLQRYFIELNKHQHIFNDIFKKLPLCIKNRFIGILNQNLPDVPLSIIAEDGVDLSSFYRDTNNHHVLYSAIELIPRFLVGLQKLSYTFEDVELTLFFGHDNGYLRAVIFPILLNLNYPQIKITSFIMNNFYHLNGNKFSTSRNNVIYLDELLDNHNYEVDDLRLYLIYTRPQYQPENFDLGDLKFLTKTINSAFGQIERCFNSSTVTPQDEPNSWMDWQKNLLAYVEDLGVLANTTYSSNHLNIKPVVEKLVILAEEVYSASELSSVIEAKYLRANNFLVKYSIHMFLSIFYPIVPSRCLGLKKKYGFKLYGIKLFNDWMRNRHVIF